MSVRKVYIAGPISNTTDYLDRFAAAVIEVAQLGHLAISPILNGHDDLGDDYLAYLKRDIRTLLECDSIYCLRGWENSRGARLEHLIAEGLSLELLYQPECRAACTALVPRTNCAQSHQCAQAPEPYHRHVFACDNQPQEDNNTNE